MCDRVEQGRITPVPGRHFTVVHYPPGWFIGPAGRMLRAQLWVGRKRSRRMRKFSLQRAKA